MPKFAKIIEASAEIITSMESRQRRLVDDLRSQEKHNTWNWINFLSNLTSIQPSFKHAFMIFLKMM